MTIGDEKVVAWQVRYSDDAGAGPWEPANEHERDYLPTLDGWEVRALIPQPAYAELAAERDRLRDERNHYADQNKMAETERGLWKSKCQATESQLAELRGSLEEANRRAEYWKAEHLAGNKIIDSVLAFVGEMENDASDEAHFSRQWMAACDHYADRLRTLAAADGGIGE